MITPSSPSFQSAGVATLWLSVSCRESTSRKISSKVRPVSFSAEARPSSVVQTGVKSLG